MRAFPVLAALAVVLSLAAGAPSALKWMAGGAGAGAPSGDKPGSVGTGNAGVPPASPSGTARPQPQLATIDKTAAEILRSAAHHYASLPEASALLHVHAVRGPKGNEITFDIDYDLAFRRPSHVALRSKGTNPAPGQIVSDGHKLHVYAGAMGSYWALQAPRLLGDAFLVRDARLASIAGGFDFEILTGLLGETPYEQLTAAATALEYAGEEQLDQLDHHGMVRAHHLVIRRPESDVNLWIAAEGPPWLLQARPDLERYLARLARNAPNAPAARMEILITYRDWLAAPVSEATFLFTPPDGARLATGDPTRGAPRVQSLVGKPAPAIVVPTLSGGEMNLANLRGKIVILDFWATWCPPCRKGLPILEQVSRAYADRNVEFFAVNVRETTTQIQSFMSRNRHQFDVALDQTGQVSKSFEVGPIPHTVIIGADGTIEAVHVGLPPNLDAQLRGELDTLLSGGKLAK